jgi:hypothetical protein
LDGIDVVVVVVIVVVVFFFKSSIVEVLCSDERGVDSNVSTIPQYFTQTSHNFTQLHTTSHNFTQLHTTSHTSHNPPFLPFSPLFTP